MYKPEQTLQEKTKKLYIIGNGFDLHHCLKTSYYNFSIYLKINHTELYEMLERYILYSSSENDLWSRFEENLANLNVEEILSNDSDRLPNYSSDEFRDRDRFIFPDIMEQKYQKLTGGIFDSFEEFIRQVEFPDYSYERRVILDKEATFLTFNYTNTLERLYSINKEKIVYLHNSAFYGSDAIVLGHGIEPKTFEDKSPEPPDDLEPEPMKEWFDRHNDYDYSYDEGKKNLLRYFEDTFKPTKEIISKHAGFFKKINDVDEIFVFGHSMSSVDLPYFQKIVECTKKDTKWIISYYNSAEHARHLDSLKNLHIDINNVTLLKLENLQEFNKQLKFDFD